MVQEKCVCVQGEIERWGKNENIMIKQVSNITMDVSGLRTCEFFAEFL